MAASTTAVTVLTPNGRRQTVKVSQNTPLLQVLEDVCNKHGFNPDDHGLKFQRNVLDLTLQWRFASLPNNAKLEMVPGTRKQPTADSQVRIALQMQDGSRLQGTFSCGQSLWELLTHFPETRELDQSGLTPVCVYMRDEVGGEEALKKATLKSLGLTGGSAIVRFLLKKNKPSGEDDGADAVETSAMPTTLVAKESTPRPTKHPDPAVPRPDTSAVRAPNHTAIQDQPAETLPEPAPSPPDVSQSRESAARISPVEDRERAGPSGLHSPNQTSSPSAAFIPFSGGGQRLGGPGAVVAVSSSSPSLMGAAGGSPKAKKAKPSHSANAKAHVSPANRQHEYMEKREDFLEPVVREPLVYHLDHTAQHQDDYRELPDEFFEVTVDDIRKRFAQLKNERRLLEETPLMTKALREAQMKEKIERYPKVVLRVQFPDRHVLQGFFRPLETVAAVRNFVKSYLENPQIPFNLFITPPKTILNDPSATLFQADLFPGALVYFSSDVKTDHYLQKEHLNSSVSASQANESIASCMPRSPNASSSSLAAEDGLSPPEPAMETRRVRRDDQDPSESCQPPQRATPAPGKVPKWLKLPGKK